MSLRAATGGAQKGASNTFTAAQSVEPAVGTISGAVSINLGALASSTGVTWTTSPLPVNSNNLELTATANVTSLAVTDGTSGTTYNIALIEDGTGGWTLPASITGASFGSAGAPTLTTTAGAVNFISGAWLSTGTLRAAANLG